MARWITFIIFGGGGLVMLYVGVTQYFLQRRLLANAITIEATIVKSEVFRGVSADTDRRTLRDNSTTSYRPELLFRYSYDDKEYESDLLNPTIIVQGYGSYDAAAEELKPFPVGARVQAYLDTKNPDKAFLVAQTTAGPMVFIILGVVLPPLAWFVGKYV
jgi:hypothetical protein